MPRHRTHPLIVAARALPAMLPAFAAVVLVDLCGSWLAARVGLPGGDERRLAWDLGWAAFAGVAGAWTVTRLAARVPCVHALAFFLVALAVDGVAVATMGGDYPGWFSAGIPVSLPLQVLLGTWWALHGRARNA